jgi:hypothetical protein
MIKKRISIFEILVVGAILFLCCQFAYALTNSWEDDDSRVDGSVDTMDTVDTFINTLSQDIHERVLSADGESPEMRVNWTAANVTCADLGTVTTVDINGGTLDNITLGGSVATTITNTTLTKATGVTTFTASGDLDIGAHEFRAQQLQADIADGTTPMIITSTTKVSNLNADTLDGYNTGTTAAANVIYRCGADNYMPDDTVDTTALKTASGEVSTATNAHLTLPGGEYGFYPQVKGDIGNDTGIQIARNREDTGSYATIIYINIESGTCYAQQRYVTASGIDRWTFLMIDKNTKEILSVSTAKDHPSYGNGGDPDKISHPFLNYNEDDHTLFLLDKDTTNLLEQESEVTGRSIATLINEEFKITNQNLPYVPLHSGEFIDTDPVLIETIPDYIKVRKLVRLTTAEKAQKIIKAEEKRVEYEQEKAKKEQDKEASKTKLKALGLTKDEVEALVGE